MDVTIDATGHMVTLNGGGRAFLFVVEYPVTLSLRGLALINGYNSHGGAILNTGTLNVAGCTFSGNTAREGGAIMNVTGIVTMVNSTFSGNTARDRFAGWGAAIVSHGGVVTVVGSTFSDNSSDSGSAISNRGGTMMLALSVVAGNTTNRGDPDIEGNVIDGGGNVIGNIMNNHGLTAESDRLNVAPLLAPLGDNGGTVETMALQTGSPAIAIAACPLDPMTMLPLATDARGVPRPQGAGANCDAGSYQSG